MLIFVQNGIKIAKILKILPKTPFSSPAWGYNAACYSVARFVTEIQRLSHEEIAMPKKSTKKSAKKVGATKKSGVKRAGRPKGSGVYGCETKAVRVPAHLEEDIKNYALRKVKAGK